MKKIKIDHKFYEQIQFDIDRIDRKTDSYRAYYYTLRIMLIVLASAITVLSGMKGLCEDFVYLSIMAYSKSLLDRESENQELEPQP